MDPEVVEFAVGEAATRTLIYRASVSDPDPPPLLILAHGAGASQLHPFMVRYARGLAERGVHVATFDFLYMAAKRRTPDRAPVLEATWRAAIDALRPRFANSKLFVGGKSMGGRYASMIAAAAPDGLAGLVCLGYPLHPPDKPAELRVAHLPNLRIPTLIVQGTRDEFGSPDELRPHFAKVAAATIHAVDGGDHSFKVPKAKGDPHPAILDTIAAWIRATGSGTP